MGESRTTIVLEMSSAKHRHVIDFAKYINKGKKLHIVVFTNKPRMSLRELQDPVALVFGKDLSSLIYLYAYQMQMRDVNAQYLFFLKFKEDDQSIRFGTVTPGSTKSWFNVWFNVRSPLNMFSQCAISHQTCTERGWIVCDSTVPLSKNYW